MPTIPPETFFSCDLRVGTVASCQTNPLARKPAYVLEIDFGADIGRLVSSAQLTELYTPEDLVGRQGIAVVNFPSKRIAGVESRCLVLGVPTDSGVALLGVDRAVVNGLRVL